MSNIRDETIVVAMSGGVDSSVAAGLLLEEGYRVVGITLQIWQESTTQSRSAGCCSIGAVEDARRVASKLGIPHYVLNYRDYFAEKVINGFVEEYKNGRTPNPCISCNRYVKFDALLSQARSLGAHFLATGHYARVRFNEESRRWNLLQAIDCSKDQTYALYNFTQEQLAHTMMPLGSIENKSATRRIAGELGLNVANKPDSQEICFVQDGSYIDFLARTAPETVMQGDIVDTSGKRRGAHDGIAFYTVGQRRRVNIGSPIPLYVLSIDATTNTITVGSDEDLYANALIANDLNWIESIGVEDLSKVTAKIRYNMDPVPVHVTARDNSDEIHVQFETTQRAISPGQSVVLYAENSVIGGGTIMGKC